MSNLDQLYQQATQGGSYSGPQSAPVGTDPFQVGSWNGQMWVPWTTTEAPKGRVSEGGQGSPVGLNAGAVTGIGTGGAEDTNLDPGYAAYLRANPTYGSNGKIIEPFGIAPSSVVDQNDVGGGFLDNLLNKGLPIATAVGLGAAFGPAAGAALAPAGASAATSGAITGAASGAISGGSGAGLTGGNVGKGVLIGGIAGGLGGSGLGQNATGALSSLGIPAPLAAGLVKGALGAGVGALGGAITGTGVGHGAEVGAIAGGASGVAGNATSSPAVGTATGTIAGNLANKYLPPPSSSQVPSTAGGLPSLPGMPTGGSQGSSGATTSTNGSTVTSPNNIGAYSGFTQGPDTSGLGYAPRTQIQNPVQNYATYGQGPEAQFFTGEQGAPASAPNIGIQVVPTSPQQRI